MTGFPTGIALLIQLHRSIVVQPHGKTASQATKIQCSDIKKGEVRHVPSMRSPDRHTVVVGGGIIGVCCAHLIALQNCDPRTALREEMGESRVLRERRIHCAGPPADQQAGPSVPGFEVTLRSVKSSVCGPAVRPSACEVALVL